MAVLWPPTSGSGHQTVLHARRWGSHLTSQERWGSHLANAGEVIFIFYGHWGSREYELELDTCDEHLLMMKFDICQSRLGAV